MLIPDNVRAFLAEPRTCVMATLSADGSPHLTVMWYDLVGDRVVLNTTRGLVKERNLRRDPRMALCVAAGERYVTLTGRAQLVEDRGQQEHEVNRMAVRYKGAAGARHWDTIAHQDRLGIHMRVEHLHTRGFV